MKIVIPNIKLPFNHSDEQMIKEVSEKLRISTSLIMDVEIKKRSVDARKKPDIYFVYTLIVSVKGTIRENTLKKVNATIFKFKQYIIPEIKNKELMDSKLEQPIVIGAGPAGLFATLILAKAGMKPILFERGEEASIRKQTIADFIKTGELNLNSNITFGEGGAGTFSDGKLNTGIKDKFLRKEFILKTLVENGANPEILYMAKPHVGTDHLVEVVSNIRKEIISLGGTVHFNSLVTKIEANNDSVKLFVDNKSETYISNNVVLAVGHSARDTFRMLNTEKVNMESKPFAIGLRIEHPQIWINKSQYGDKHYENPLLPTAEYKLTHQSSNGRGVYSFCMCPGGYVVNSSSQEGMCVCNGMSLFARDNDNANSAIIVTVKPEDFESKHPLAGIEFQEKWEKLVYDLNDNYDLVTEDYESFYESVKGKKLPEKQFMNNEFYQIDEVVSSCESQMVIGSINECLPNFISESIVEGIEAFGKRIVGFDHPKARLVGVESRTSSPLKIIRNDNLMSNINGLYPCGEGAGHAGGIMSAAIDGIKVAEQILSKTQ